MSQIDPTVGRMILFHPPSNSANPTFAPSATCAAIIAAVLPDDRLNLAVFDSNGAVHSMEKVPLIQEGDDAPADGYYAEWMPYQKSVAKGETAPVLHAPPTKLDKLTASSSEPSPFSAAANPVPSAPVTPAATPTPVVTPVTTTSQPAVSPFTPTPVTPAT